MTSDINSTKADSHDAAGDRQLQPNPDVISQRLENTMILLHLRTNRFYELNRTGARFWELIESGLSQDEIRERMMEEFEVDPVELAREMKDLLDSMEKENLILPK